MLFISSSSLYKEFVFLLYIFAAFRSFTFIILFYLFRLTLYFVNLTNFLPNPSEIHFLVPCWYLRNVLSSAVILSIPSRAVRVQLLEFLRIHAKRFRIRGNFSTLMSPKL